MYPDNHLSQKNLLLVSMIQLIPIKFSELKVTKGIVTEIAPDEFLVETPSLRGTVSTQIDTIACLKFRYFGVTDKRDKSGDGYEHHQIGIQLLAKNSCNLLYVMWRLQPEELVIKVKHNPGQTKHSECGNHGYHTIDRMPYPGFQIDEPHELLASISDIDSANIKLQVWIDQQVALQTQIDRALLHNTPGVPGIRSDNGKYQFQYLVNFHDSINIGNN
jgi:hypothetical protein